MALTNTLKRPHAPRRNRPLAEVEADQERKPLLGQLHVGQKRVEIKGFVIVLITGIALLIILSAVNRYQNNMPCKAVMISVFANDDNAFTDSSNLYTQLVENYGREVSGEKMGEIILTDLEEIIEENPFVSNAEVYKSIQGVVYVEANMRKPIARVLNEDGSQFYLDELGQKFPTSNMHAANVPLVHGSFVEEIAPVDSFDCVTIETAIPLLKYINEQPFWNDMISDLAIQQDGEVILYPRFGDIYVEFGQPVRIPQKFEKLKLFYDQVVKEVGWKKYRSVSLEYRGQVVGRRR